MQTDINYTKDREVAEILDNSYLVDGSMGKGANGATPIEFSDTRKSSQVVRLLIAVSEGICTALSEVYFNYVPSSNFNCTIEWRDGTPNQSVVTGFESANNPSTNFMPFINMTTTGTYIASVAWQAHSTIVTLTASVLRDVDTVGNVVMSNSVHYIYIRANNISTWTLYYISDIWAKVSSNWSIDISVRAAYGVIAGTNWEIKIVRVSPDDVSARKESKMSWTALTEVIELTLNYPNTALVAITLWDASQFGGQIPDILFRIKGIKVRVPNNYDHDARVYNGNWDGTFTSIVYYTSNPAYVLLDCLTSAKCLGIADAFIDLPSFYLLGVECDVAVSNGFGGFEPKYTINNQFTVRENVATFLNYILSVCNANFTTNEFGQISVFFDSVTQVVTKQVTNANVIDGMFRYSSNDLEERVGLVNVTYSNDNNYGKTDTATWVDQAIIDRYGFQTLDIALVGCSSKASAIRKARWACYQNAYLTDLVTFATLHYGMQFKVGELVRVADNYTSGNASAGVVKNVAFINGNTRVYLDRYIAGITKVSVVLGDHTSILPVITMANDVLVVEGTMPITVGSPFLAIHGINPSVWKVIGIENSEGVYTITCVIHTRNVNMPPTGIQGIPELPELITPDEVTIASALAIDSLSLSSVIENSATKETLHTLLAIETLGLSEVKTDGALESLNVPLTIETLWLSDIADISDVLENINTELSINSLTLT